MNTRVNSAEEVEEKMEEEGRRGGGEGFKDTEEGETKRIQRGGITGEGRG